MVSGFLTYFDAMLGSQLLYKLERIQYTEVGVNKLKLIQIGFVIYYLLKMPFICHSRCSNITNLYQKSMVEYTYYDFLVYTCSPNIAIVVICLPLFKLIGY